MHHPYFPDDSIAIHSFPQALSPNLVYISTGGFSGKSVGLSLQHLPFLPQQILSLHVGDSSGMYGWMEGMVRVVVVVTGTVVEAGRAVISGRSRVIVVDAVGAAVARAARLARRTGKMAFIMILTWYMDVLFCC